ncbi:DUF4364 family protein [Peptoniphilus sp. KCTC 25270]|uniref:DUF4364 family protein n=1 Tax=Peptoniphilus sp. KCTC 25270 TaxID=2897414 RepID=UPI001E3AC996|nr:DUF4364 family protein [Peptoniphilus sp. KCTC 25270]MCD1147999.1 DUF4364 family protein [Peptoniphilus sp. KCTC 25270]
MTNNDAFALAKDKLFLLKLIESNDGTIEIKTLQQFVLELERLNYFYLMQFLQELEKTELIQKKGTFIEITQHGIDAVNLFTKNMTPEDVKQIEAFQEKQKNQPQYLVEETVTQLQIQKRIQKQPVLTISLEKHGYSPETLENIRKHPQYFLEKWEESLP